MSAVGLWLSLALMAGPFAPGPDSWTSLNEQERAELVGRLQTLSLHERVLLASERFLNTPYQVSPLGEGSGFDPDPLWRYDAVDCLTFVEQTLALSLSANLQALPQWMAALRYDGAPVYEERNHLMEAQWLPNNQRKGFLVDVTRSYGGADTQRAVKTLSPASWSSSSSRALQLSQEHQLQGRFTLDMIPLERVMRHAPSLPSGTILVVMREERPFKATRITHLGFVVQKGKRTFLRHASRNPFARVVDEDLAHFLIRNAKYEKWRVEGVALFAPSQPAP